MFPPSIITTLFQSNGDISITAATIVQGDQPSDSYIIFAQGSNLYYYATTNNLPKRITSMSGHTSTILFIRAYKQSNSGLSSILTISQTGELIRWTQAAGSQPAAPIEYVPSLVDIGRSALKVITCIDARDDNTILLGCTSQVIICRRSSTDAHFSCVTVDLVSNLLRKQANAKMEARGQRIVDIDVIITAICLKSVREEPQSAQTGTSGAATLLRCSFFVCLVNQLFYVEDVLPGMQKAFAGQGKEEHIQEQTLYHGQSQISIQLVWSSMHFIPVDAIHYASFDDMEYLFLGHRNGHLTILVYDRTASQYQPIYEGPLAPSFVTGLEYNPLLQNRSGIRYIQTCPKASLLCIVSTDSTVLFINIKRLGVQQRKISSLSPLTHSIVRHVGKLISANFEQLRSDSEGYILRLFTIVQSNETPVTLC